MFSSSRLRRIFYLNARRNLRAGSVWSVTWLETDNKNLMWWRHTSPQGDTLAAHQSRTDQQTGMQRNALCRNGRRLTCGRCLTFIHRRSPCDHPQRMLTFVHRRLSCDHPSTFVSWSWPFVRCRACWRHLQVQCSKYNTYLSDDECTVRVIIIGGVWWYSQEL